MSRVFADTSYYVALMGEQDQHHAAAVALAQGFFGQIVTTDFVLVEVGNWLSRAADRPVLLRLLEMLARIRKPRYCLRHAISSTRGVLCLHAASTKTGR